MSREDFYATLGALRESLAEPSLQDKAVPPSKLNFGPQAIRRGVAVSAFNMMEDHLEERLQSCLNDISMSQFAFGDLPDRLQEMLSVEAIAGLNNQTKFRRGGDRRVFLDANLPRVASYMSKKPTYMAFGLRRQGSNVLSDDVGRILSAIGFKKGWTRASSLAAYLGFGTVPDTLSTYGSLSVLRNRCAHESSYEMPIANLKTAIEQVISLSILLDIMLSEMGRLYRTRGISKPPNNPPVEPRVRFLDEQVDGTCEERLGPSGVTIQRHAGIDVARLKANSRVEKRFTVLRDKTLTPVELFR